MGKLYLFSGHKTVLAFLFLITAQFAGAQTQLDIRDFFLYGTRSVSVSSSATIQGNGRIGSNLQLSINSSGNLGSGLHSGGTILLQSGAVVNGNVSAANSGNGVTGFTSGTGTNISGNISVVRNVSIGGGTVGGTVRTTGTYSGPTATGGVFQNQSLQQLNLPILPILPVLSTVSCNDNNATSLNLQPGQKYGNIKGKGVTITFNGPGIYEVNSFDLDQTNKFIFDFNGSATGRIYLRVRKYMELGKVAAEFRNLPNGTNDLAAARIFTEVQGSDSGMAFEIYNGSSQSRTRWLGTVYAPNGSILIGSGTGNTEFVGALWSGRGSQNVSSNNTTSITINSGVNGRFVPFTPEVNCTGSDVTIVSVEGAPATTVNNVLTAALPCNDPDQQSTIVTTTTISSPTYKWTTTNGNLISADNVANPVIASPGTYKVVVSNAGGCNATAEIRITSCVNLAGNTLKQDAAQVVDPTLTQFYSGASNPFQTFTGEDPLINQGNNGTILVEVILQQGIDTTPSGLARSTLASNGFQQVSYNASLTSLVVTGFIPQPCPL